MCAIAGLVSVHPVSQDRLIVQRMLTSMAHRGPDDQQIISWPGVTFGHARLSILDISAAARQPMINDRGDIMLTYNGEIYNYAVLKKWLGNDRAYHSTSDTEVLLRCYEQKGIACLDRLNGMFAFAAWDQRTQRLVLVRDHIGIKPLYWWEHNGTILFSSEVKGLLASGLIKKELEPEAVHHLLSVQAVPPPLTMIRSIHALEPGSYLLWEHGHSIIQRYYRVEFSENDSLGNKVEPYIEKTKTLLTEAIAQQRQSDVPTAVALSGGLDSSLILATLTSYFKEKLITFTLSDEMLSDKVQDDGYYAKIVSDTFLSHHTELYLKPYELIQQFPRAIWAQDQPSLRNILAFFLFSKISQAVKVVFYGSGSDELFAGYGTAMFLRRVKQFQHVAGLLPTTILQWPFKHITPLQARFSTVDYLTCLWKASSVYERRQLIDWIFLDYEKSSLYHPDQRLACAQFSSSEFFKEYANGSPKSKIKLHQQLDWLGIQVEHLTQLDAVAMANSIETRVPFLDKKVVAFSAQLPGFVLAPNGVDNKFLFRQAFKNTLPPAIINRSKTGFHIDFEKYLQPYFYNLCQWLFTEQATLQRGLFSYQAIQSLIVNYFHNPAPNYNIFNKLLLLVDIELWCMLNIDNREVEELTNEMLERCFDKDRYNV